jgi:Tfp pilus assembly protein FimT
VVICRTPNRQAGITILELVVTLFLAAVLLATTASLAIPWLAREAVRSATHEIQSALQLARVESVKRNGNCRLVMQTDERTMTVWDGKRTSSTSDDELLHTVRLPGSINFARPDGSPPVTFTDLGSSSYEVEFDSDGSVSSGEGEVVLFGGGVYRRLTVFVAGGTRVSHWTGSSWETG